MAKSNNQKAKILFIEHLLRGTGENHTVSMQEILNHLSEQGITAERKSIYDDMEALRFFGYDVKFKRGRPGGYYLAESSIDLISEVPEPKQNELSRADIAVEAEMTEMQEEHQTTGLRLSAALFYQQKSISEKKMKLLVSPVKENEIREFFGDYAEYSERYDGSILLSAPLLTDPMFFGWLTAMGNEVRILKPKKAASAYRDYLKSIAREYKGI